MVRIPGRRPTKTLWIFCEGKTEKAYLDNVRCIERIRRLTIIPRVLEHRNADGILDDAIRFKNNKKDFQKGDLIACIFDRDSNTNDQLTYAKSKADREGIQISFSNPCFEYWILCHYDYIPGPIEKDNIISLINKKSGSEYEKADSELYTKTKDKIVTAHINAERIKNKHLNNKTTLISRESNPITLVFELIKIIDDFKN